MSVMSNKQRKKLIEPGSNRPYSEPLIKKRPSWSQPLNESLAKPIESKAKVESLKERIKAAIARFHERIK